MKLVGVGVYHSGFRCLDPRIRSMFAKLSIIKYRYDRRRPDIRRGSVLAVKGETNRCYIISFYDDVPLSPTRRIMSDSIRLGTNYAHAIPATFMLDWLAGIAPQHKWMIQRVFPCRSFFFSWYGTVYGFRGVAEMNTAFGISEARGGTSVNLFSWYRPISWCIGLPPKCFLVRHGAGQLRRLYWKTESIRLLCIAGIESLSTLQQKIMVVSIPLV